MLVKFEQNCMVQTTKKKKKKNGVFITFFDKELTPFLKTFVAEIIV